MHISAFMQDNWALKPVHLPGSLSAPPVFSLMLLIVLQPFDNVLLCIFPGFSFPHRLVVKKSVFNTIAVLQ